MEPVRTHRAKSVVEAARLHRAKDRRERGLTLVEGPQLIADIRAAEAVVLEVFGLEPDPESHVIPVDQRALARLSGTKSPRGPVAVVEIPVEHLDRTANLMVSVGVSDPGNLGAMIRTAAAFRWGFAYTEGSADPWSPKAIRAGAGGQFQTPISKVASLDEVEEWTTVAAVARGGEPADSVQARPVALLVGEEAHGLGDDVIDWATHRLTVQTPGVTESLNAAVAAGIAVYALERGSEEAGHDV